MSTSSHSSAPSAVGNSNVPTEWEINLPMTNLNHSPAPSATCNNDLLANRKKPHRPFPLSNTNHSPATSAVWNGKVSDKGKEPAWGSQSNEANEAGPSVIGGSSLYSDLSSSIRMPSQCSYSDVVPQSCSSLNHNYNDGINDVFRNGSSLGFLNGSRPCYSEENGWGNYSRCDNRIHDGYGYRYDQGLRCMAPPPEQLRPFSAPLTSPSMCPVPFNGNHLPSFWPTFQGPVSLSYVPFDMYRYPIQPQQSNFFSSLDDLRARLRKQIEYYFCSENLRTDYYLKNLMDRCGWVSIILIMKFRKVVALLKEKDTKLQSASIFDVLQVRDRSLSNDQQFVLDSVRPSVKVEVQGDRVRKRHKWHKWVSKPP